MDLRKILNQSSDWLNSQGPDSDIVISSRIRIARNLAGCPFSAAARLEDEKKILYDVRDAIAQAPSLKDTYLIELSSLSDVEKNLFLERHLVSHDLVESAGAKAVCINQKQTISIMINEEDHVRVQGMHPGFQLSSLWDMVHQIDDDLAEHLSFAFSVKYGYLTSCPTNVGTGMRASVMMHLPALVLTKQIHKVIEAIVKLGLTVRGLYGEGTEASGDLFQISNQITLGHSEEDILDNIERIVKQVIEHEKSARQVMFQETRVQIEDRIWRAYALLKHSRIMTSEETINLLSALRLGVGLGVIQNINQDDLSKLLIVTKPAHIQFAQEGDMSAYERDVKRADLIRGLLDRA